MSVIHISENNVKVSIIVPVYNVEKYLKQCLDSIINQTLKNIEVICINDGSTDSSLSILASYTTKDSRIKIVSQKNMGLGAARNTGMRHASGEYIGFVDSDDWIDKDMFRRLYEDAESNKTDITMCQIATYDDKKQNFTYDDDYYTLNVLNERIDKKVFNHKDTADFPFSIAITTWNKIYKRDFLEENNIKFPELIFEDNVFFVDTYFRAKRVSFVKKPLYFYRINREDSIIGLGDSRYFDIISVYSLMRKSLEDMGIYEIYSEGFLNLNLFVYDSKYSNIGEEHKDDLFDLIKEDLMKWEDWEVEKLNFLYQLIYSNFTLANNSAEFDTMSKIIKLEQENKHLHNDNNVIKVSVVVPVYNVEEYLGQCLDSVINQSLEDIEVICVNDGSTDSSLSILVSYAAMDSRIRVVSQKNMGLGAARNTGMRHASGEYIGFVDSDDWIDKDMFLKLYEGAKYNMADISMCQIATYDDKNQNFNYDDDYYTLNVLEGRIDKKVFNHDDTIDFSLSISVTAVNKLYNRFFLEGIDAKFHQLFFEDNVFFVDTYFRTKRVSFVKKPLYFYRINREDSIITKGDSKYFDIIEIYKLIKKSLKGVKLYDIYEKKVLNQNIFAFNSRYSSIMDKYKPEFFDLIKKDLITWNSMEIEKLTRINKKIYANFLLANGSIEFDSLTKLLEVEEKHRIKKNKYRRKIKSQKKIYSKKINNYNGLIGEIESSSSWKITKPIRTLNNLLKKIKRIFN